MLQLEQACGHGFQCSVCLRCAGSQNCNELVLPPGATALPNCRHATAGDDAPAHCVSAPSVGVQPEEASFGPARVAHLQVNLRDPGTWRLPSFRARLVGYGSQRCLAACQYAPPNSQADLCARRHRHQGVPPAPAGPTVAERFCRLVRLVVPAQWPGNGNIAGSGMSGDLGSSGRPHLSKARNSRAPASPTLQPTCLEVRCRTRPRAEDCDR